MFSAAIFFVAATLPAVAVADNGNAPTTMSFFSGGQGGHADWFVTADQPPGDLDRQAIRLITTNGAPTYEHGYAGILFHHVEGIPANAFPDSSFWVKTRDYAGPSFGSPRLVVAFQTAAGTYDGYADLRPLTLLPMWQQVSDPEEGGDDGWDVMGGPCVYSYNVPWSIVQDCFSGHTVLTAYIVADAYGIYHLIDDIEVNGKIFSSARDNGNGNNSSAGPTATTDPSLLPPIPISLP